MTELSYDTFFATLSGNRRLEILHFLQRADHQSVNDIAAGTGIEQSAVSHSLNKLLACEFVHIEVDGKFRYYSLNDETIVPLLALIDRHIAKFCTGVCECCSKKGCSEKNAPTETSPSSDDRETNKNE